jgi:lipopolysaccharide biosynthesis glycosyltransferase
MYCRWHSLAIAGLLINARAPAMCNADIHVVYSATDNLIPYVMASMNSVAEHTSERCLFYFIGSTPIPNAVFFNMSTLVNQLSVYMRENMKGPDTMARLQHMENYARMAIPDLLPNVQKAVYLDADTLCAGDLAPLVRKHPAAENAVLAAGKGVGFVKTTYNITTKKHEKLSRMYGFNAGVMIMHLDRWRRHNISRLVAEWAYARNKEVTFRGGSQPVLILAVRNRFSLVRQFCNACGQVVSGRLHQSRLQWCRLPTCVIRHWSGPNKYWMPFGNLKDLVPPKTYDFINRGLYNLDPSNL